MMRALAFQPTKSMFGTYNLLQKKASSIAVITESANKLLQKPASSQSVEPKNICLGDCPLTTDVEDLYFDINDQKSTPLYSTIFRFT